MRNAPSVSYPVGRSFLRTLIHGLTLALMWLVCGAWAMLARTDEGDLGIVLLSCLLVTVVLVWALLRPTRGRLRWDGQDWFWSDAGRAAAEDIRGQLKVRLDWQGGMLLEFMPQQAEAASTALGQDAAPERGAALPWRSRWLWVEQVQAPIYWNALRRAAWADGGHRPRVSA